MKILSEIYQGGFFNEKQKDRWQSESKGNESRISAVKKW
jgi:hypothetical protein